MNQLPYPEYEIILEYLFNIYRGKISNDELKVAAFFEFVPAGGSVAPVYEKIEPDIVHHFFGHQWYLIDLTYKEYKLWLICRAFLNQKEMDPRPFAEYYIDYNFQCRTTGSLELDLISILKKIAIAGSRFCGKVIKIKDKTEYQSILDLVEIISPADISLDNIFLPAQKKEFINLFISTINNYKGKNLRYLLNGSPGTAKTQIIYSIMKKSGNKATYIILENRNIQLTEIFNFCSLFEPCVLVIDDLDLLIDERGQSTSKNELSAFLSYLDGFNYNNLFILATTNDKKLVDIAAQRPGRFNLIIDVDEIDPENYMSLILRETEDEEIINLFTFDRLKELSVKRITGAFIVNLIKLLKTYKEHNGTISEDKLGEILRFSYNGFYKTNNKQTEVGFLN